MPFRGRTSLAVWGLNQGSITIICVRRCPASFYNHHGTNCILEVGTHRAKLLKPPSPLSHGFNIVSEVPNAKSLFSRLKTNERIVLMASRSKLWGNVEWTHFQCSLQRGRHCWSSTGSFRVAAMKLKVLCYRYYHVTCVRFQAILHASWYWTIGKEGNGSRCQNF